MKKDSNNDFWNKWKVERKYGFKKYYIRHMRSVFAIMIGIFAASCLMQKKLNIVYLFISMSVALIFPFMAWGINELRLRVHQKKMSNSGLNHEDGNL